MQPEPLFLESFYLAGIEARTTNEDEMDSARAKIPGLYQRYFSGQVASKVPNAIDRDTFYAAYCDYESDHRGPYTLCLGNKTSSLDSISDGMRGIQVPTGDYLLFSADGRLPDIVVRTWQKIWQYFDSDDCKYERAYSVDFERYDQRQEGKVDIFIAIK